MGMRPRNFQQQIKTQFKSQNEIQKDLTDNLGFQYQICPFKIILGATNSTEAGYKPPTSVPNDYTSFSKIFTGREAILAVWNNSFDLIEPDLKTYNSVGKKTLKIGDVFYGFVQSDQLGIAYSASPANGAFIQEQAIKNVVIRIPNKDKNFDFINNILQNMYCLYMIPEINAVKNKDNYSADRQWYFLETATKCYNNDKELGYIDCTFSSLNDKLATSGMAINQYVQVSAPGEPVAIPGLDLNKNIILDPDYLSPRPVTHAQVTFYGTVGTIAIALWGRRIDINDGQTITMNPTHLIFPMNYQSSTFDPVSFSALPETNYVLTVGAQSTVDTYQQWQDILAPAYDDGATKTFEGHILTDVDKTTATNPIDEISKQYLPYWDEKFLNSITLDEKVFETTGNPYFIYYNPNTKFLIGNLDGYIINNLKFKNLRNLNSLMYFIYNAMNEIPMSVRETTKIEANTIPIFASFFNAFTAGMDVGFKRVSNLLIPKFPVVNFLMSAELYRFYSTVFYAKQVDKNIMPYDIFRNGTPDSVPALLGTSSHMTSFTFNLTDNINIANYDINNKTQVKIESKELTNIAQLDPENNNQIQLLPNVENYNLNQVAFDNKKEYSGFYIDMIDLLVQGKCNFKITFYSLPDHYDGAVSDDYSIWSGTYQTVAKASSNIRLIRNTFVLANNTYSFRNKYRYPKAVNPPPPHESNPKTIIVDFSNYPVTNSYTNKIDDNGYSFYPSQNTINGAFEKLEIDITDYGYSTWDYFIRDYKQLKFSLTVSLISEESKEFINTYDSSNPIFIDDIKDLPVTDQDIKPYFCDKNFELKAYPFDWKLQDGINCQFRVRRLTDSAEYEINSTINKNQAKYIFLGNTNDVAQSHGKDKTVTFIQAGLWINFNHSTNKIQIALFICGSFSLTTKLNMTIKWDLRPKNVQISIR